RHKPLCAIALAMIGIKIDLAERCCRGGDVVGQTARDDNLAVSAGFRLLEIVCVAGCAGIDGEPAPVRKFTFQLFARGLDWWTEMIVVHKASHTCAGGLPLPDIDKDAELIGVMQTVAGKSARFSGQRLGSGMKRVIAG